MATSMVTRTGGRGDGGKRKMIHVYIRVGNEDTQKGHQQTDRKRERETTGHTKTKIGDVKGRRK